jgi:hypothetical protein
MELITLKVTSTPYILVSYLNNSKMEDTFKLVRLDVILATLNVRPCDFIFWQILKE